MIKTNGRQKWIMKEHSRESGRVANNSKGFFLLFFGIPPCTLRVPTITNVRTKQNFASIAFFITTAELDLRNKKKKNWKKNYDFDPWESKPYRKKHLPTSEHNLKEFQNTEALFFPTFPWTLKRRNRAKYHTDWLFHQDQVLTQTAGRHSYLFPIYSSRVIQAFPWSQRLMHYEWQRTLTAFLNGFGSRAYFKLHLLTEKTLLNSLVNVSIVFLYIFTWQNILLLKTANCNKDFAWNKEMPLCSKSFLWIILRQWTLIGSPFITVLTILIIFAWKESRNVKISFEQVSTATF